MTSQLVIFTILALIAVISGVMTITRRNPVKSALYLILNFIALACIYLTLNAQFVAIIQILVYAGAIMVLVLFVLMLLNLEDESRLTEHLNVNNYIAAGLAGAVLALLITTLVWVGAAPLRSMTDLAPNSVEIGTVEAIGLALFTDYTFPVILTSILLLAAVIGAVAMAKKKFP